MAEVTGSSPVLPTLRGDPVQSGSPLFFSRKGKRLLLRRQGKRGGNSGVKKQRKELLQSGSLPYGPEEVALSPQWTPERQERLAPPIERLSPV
jgi:hypothetical protein